MTEKEALLFDALKLAIIEIKTPSNTPRAEILEMLTGVVERCGKEA